jgi:hypothetical protein
MSPADEFRSTIANLLAGRDVLNAELLGKSRAARQARAYSLQGLYLVAVRSFEAFLEDQVIALACEKTEWTSRRLSNGTRVQWSRRLKERRPQLVKSIILRGREYVDFMPYEATIEISKLLFHGGRPFANLEQPYRISLTRCIRVRNYIAHESDHSYKMFLRSYSQIKTSRVSRPKAIHYLDDQIRAGVTFFEHDISELVTISRFLS